MNTHTQKRKGLKYSSSNKDRKELRDTIQQAVYQQGLFYEEQTEQIVNKF